MLNGTFSVSLSPGPALLAKLEAVVVGPTDDFGNTLTDDFGNAVTDDSGN